MSRKPSHDRSPLCDSLTCGGLESPTKSHHGNHVFSLSMFGQTIVSHKKKKNREAISGPCRKKSRSGIEVIFLHRHLGGMTTSSLNSFDKIVLFPNQTSCWPSNKKGGGLGKSGQLHKSFDIRSAIRK